MLAGGQRALSRAGIARRCALVALDFDETLTANDTCAVLGNIRATLAAAVPERAAAAARWDGLAAQFAEEYAATVPGLLPNPPLPTWEPDRFQRWVGELRKFDMRCNAQLEQGALAGIPASALAKAAAEEVLPREGAAVVLQQLMHESAAGRTGTVHVLSANWCDVFIHEALRCHFVSEGSLPVVTANRLVMGTEEPPLSTGEIAWAIASAGDKSIWLDPLGSRYGMPGAEQELQVVVGDSVGDLPAMVKAGVGVIVKESSSLLATVDAFGLTVEPLDKLLADIAVSGDGGDALQGLARPGEPVLLQATDWQQIGELLFGADWQAEEA